MKTLNVLFVFFLFFVTSSCKNSSSEADNENESTENSTGKNSDGRYDLKSGIVTSKTMTSMMGGDITTILYFDDHGGKSMTETITKMSVMGQNMETHTKTLILGDMMYTWETKSNTGTKMKIDMSKGAANMDYKKMSKEMMDQWKIKKEGTGTVMGKKCDIFSMNAEGMEGKYYVWDNITMKAETNMGGMNMTIEVTDLKENPSIPNSTFELPSDVTFTEVNASGS